MKWTDLPELTNSPVEVDFLGRKKQGRTVHLLGKRHYRDDTPATQKECPCLFAGKVGPILDTPWISLKLKETGGSG